MWRKQTNESGLHSCLCAIMTTCITVDINNPPISHRSWGTFSLHFCIIFLMKLSQSSITEGIPLCYVMPYPLYWLLIIFSACACDSHVNTPVLSHFTPMTSYRNHLTGLLGRRKIYVCPRESTWRLGTINVIDSWIIRALNVDTNRHLVFRNDPLHYKKWRKRKSFLKDE